MHKGILLKRFDIRRCGYLLFMSCEFFNYACHSWIEIYCWGFCRERGHPLIGAHCFHLNSHLAHIWNICYLQSICFWYASVYCGGFCIKPNSSVSVFAKFLILDLLGTANWSYCQCLTSDPWRCGKTGKGFHFSHNMNMIIPCSAAFNERASWRSMLLPV